MVDVDRRVGLWHAVLVHREILRPQVRYEVAVRILHRQRDRDDACLPIELELDRARGSGFTLKHRLRRSRRRPGLPERRARSESGGLDVARQTHERKSDGQHPRWHYERPGFPLGSSVTAPVFGPSPREISRRRPRETCAGGDGTTISSTPSLKVAFA